MNDDAVVSEAAPSTGDDLLALYDRCLPEVYGYLLARCGNPAVAEDLTSETFIAAVAGLRRGTIPQLTAAWLIGVARHKLVDHWRRVAADTRRLRAVESGVAEYVDDWDERLDTAVTQQVLAELATQHRIALVLRYLDGLPVPEVARLIGRTVHATEALLVRARIAFRRAYELAVSDESAGEGVSS